MKKVIFEEPKDTISFDQLKETDFVGVEMQNTKGMLVKWSGNLTVILADLNVAPIEFNIIGEMKTVKGEWFNKFTAVYQFDSLPELIEWLCQ